MQSETEKPTPDAAEEVKEALARRQANAAVALLKTKHADKAWPVLKHSSDPRARSYLVHLLAPLGVDVMVLVRRLREEPDVSIRRALILSLGEFDVAQFAAADRKALIDRLLDLYRTDPDAGLHAAADWLLRQKGWDQGSRLSEIDAQLQVDDEHLHHPPVGADKREWYVNTYGQTFAIVKADQPFRMGSPDKEAGRQEHEVPHQQRIDRTFAIASNLVTKAQYGRFQAANPDVFKNDQLDLLVADDAPQLAVDWYDAARYCNWLSQSEGIPKEQWCYEPNLEGKYSQGMKHAADYLQRRGYRLPTEAEWEYACRSGAQTSRYYGTSVHLLAKYAWFLDNSDFRVGPVGMKKPNDFGLFDMLGNAWEWCDGVFELYADLHDSGTNTAVRDDVKCVQRGGSFSNPAGLVRSAFRFEIEPTNRSLNVGFRAARDLPLRRMMICRLVRWNALFIPLQTPAKSGLLLFLCASSHGVPSPECDSAPASPQGRPLPRLFA